MGTVVIRQGGKQMPIYQGGVVLGLYGLSWLFDQTNLCNLVFRLTSK